MRKVQSQLLISQHTRDRADALALVRQEARAEVIRTALEGSGLGHLETVHRRELEDLDTIAALWKMTRADLVERATADRVTWREIRAARDGGRKRYPAPRVEA